MKEANRRKQVEKMISAGLNNLFISQNELDFDNFSITVIEALMLLLAQYAQVNWVKIYTLGHTAEPFHLENVHQLDVSDY